MKSFVQRNALLALACSVLVLLINLPMAAASGGSSATTPSSDLARPWLDDNGNPVCVWTGVNSGPNPVFYCGAPLPPGESMAVEAQAAIGQMAQQNKAAAQPDGFTHPECAAGQVSNTRAPVISGTPSPGGTLNVDPGSWFVCIAGDTTGISFGYSWTGNTNPAGSSYTVICADAGHVLQVTVTATSNGEFGGSASAASNQVGISDSTSCHVPPPPPPPTPAPTVTFTADSTNLNAGQSTILRYSGSGTITGNCIESGGPGNDGWGGYPPSSSGTFTTGLLTSTVTYTYECSGPGGNTVKSVTITVNTPTPPAAVTSFYTDAGSGTIANGTSTVIHWNCSYSNAATATGGWSGIKAVSGQETTSALTVPTSFTIVCNGANGGPDSAPSTINVNVAAASDSQAPSVPANLRVAGTAADAIAVQWDPSTDNKAVTGYGLYQNGVSAGSTPQTSTTFTGLTCGTTYTLAVDAFDLAGNRSAKASINATTSACPPPTADTQAPSVPGNLKATASTATSVSVSWSPSTDNVAVAGYGLYMNGVSVSSASQTSASFGGLVCGTSYALAVDAFDAAGNRSAKVSITAKTSACSSTTTDADSDGVADSHDNCIHNPVIPQDYNPDQADADGNGIGNACQTVFPPVSSVYWYPSQSGTGVAYQSCTATRCLQGATPGERCQPVNDSLHFKISAYTVFHQKVALDLCWIPGRKFTRIRPDSISITDMTECGSMCTYPYKVMGNNGVAISFLSNQEVTITTQWTVGTCILFWGPGCTFELYPKLVTHYRINGTNPPFPPATGTATLYIWKSFSEHSKG